MSVLRAAGSLINDPARWVTQLVEDSPRLSDSGPGPETWRWSALHWCEVWRHISGQGLPSRQAAVDKFATTMFAEGDLTDEQIERVCRTTLSPRDRPLELWLAEAMERFVWRIRPWIPLWVSFAHWSVRWSIHRQRRQLIFLARDMLSTYLTARRLDSKIPTGLDIRLAHASRSYQGGVGKMLGIDPANTFVPQPFAVVDSGCYGTVISRLVRELDSPVTPAEDAACLFYFSRNPKIFGFLNYLLSPSILEADIIGHDVADFVIYAGDLLEALPKPYRVVDHGDVFAGEIQDLLTFCLSMAILKEVDDYVDAGPLASISQTRRRALELYNVYAHADSNRVLADSLLFHTPAPKQLPASYGFGELDFHSFPPQNEFFGSVPG